MENEASKKCEFCRKKTNYPIKLHCGHFYCIWCGEN